MIFFKYFFQVDFNEPLSALQRATEDLEYSNLLEKASQESDSCKRLAFVATFALSAYSTTAQRTTKPFNPLLGETFECDRWNDKGFVSVAEQVSHHPPVSALWARGRMWTLNQAYSVQTKLKGRSLVVHQQGATYLKFNDSDTVYIYHKVSNFVIIFFLILENN